MLVSAFESFLSCPTDCAARHFAHMAVTTENTISTCKGFHLANIGAGPHVGQMGEIPVKYYLRLLSLKTIDIYAI